MTRADLLEALAVERHTPSPRPPKFTRCDPPEPISAQQAADNRARLLAALDGDGVVVDFYERRRTA